jgi:hypothetical protein
VGGEGWYNGEERIVREGREVYQHYTGLLQRAKVLPNEIVETLP